MTVLCEIDYVIKLNSGMAKYPRDLILGTIDIIFAIPFYKHK